MIDKFIKTGSLKIAIFVYTFLIILCWGINGLMGFCFGTYLEKTGKMPNITYTKEELQLDGVKPNDFFENGLISTDSDPKIIINFDREIYVSNVQMDIEYSMLPGEIVSYYSKGERGFSERRRVMGQFLNGAQATFEYGIIKCDALRIDPTMFGGNAMNLSKITINTHRTFGDYFKIYFSDLFRFSILSTMAVSFILIIKQACETCYNKKSLKR
ncbi:MAG: hypothetical protein RR198_05575 [Oscillospiraceae bacterium]